MVSGRCAAHVAGDGVGDAGLRQRGRGRHHARGRPRHHGLGRLARNQPGRDRAAIAVHHQKIAPEAPPLEFVLQPSHIAVENRLHRRVDARRRAALVFAEFGEQRVAERHIVIGPDLPRDGARPQLMGGVGVGVQEMDDEALAAIRRQPQRRGPHGVFIERRHHPAARVHALGNLDPQLARDQRLERAEQAVGLRSGAPAEFQRVAKPLGGDQPDFRYLALEHGVGRGRGPVDDQVERGGRNAGGLDGGEHPERLILRRRGNLGQPYARAGLIRLMEEQIGEGAAHIDARHAPHRLAPLNRRSFVHE